MLNKTNNLILLFLFLTLLACGTNDNNTQSPYINALNHQMSDENLFTKIALSKEVILENGKVINIYGYLNKNNHTLYSSVDFVKDPLHVKSILGDLGGIILYKNFNKKVYLDYKKCNAGESLVEVNGVLNYKDGNYYIDNIKAIYDFDTRPMNQGGAGLKYKCY